MDRPNVVDNIEYSMVVLGLSASELAGIVETATGLSVDVNSADFLQKLNEAQLEAVWNRLSKDARWNWQRKAGEVGCAAGR